MARFYAVNRVRWEEFYLSERVVFERVAARFGPPRTVLDAGCAVGGLGLALQERFGTVEDYVGVDVNSQVITLATERAKPWQRFMCADVVSASLADRFQWVVSLACVDFNLEPVTTIRSLWKRVMPGGILVVSLRLTDLEGMCDPQRSYQRISFFEEQGSAEIANYVVFNVAEAVSLMAGLEPELVIAYGYWGSPSRTVITPYTRLAFTVFAARKVGETGAVGHGARIELDVPADLVAGLRPRGAPA